MTSELKHVLNSVYELCESVAEKGNLYEVLEIEEGFPLSNILKLDLMCFLAYLAAADGVISWKECRYIGSLFDVNITPDKLNELIMEKDIYSVEFETTVPKMLQLFVACDNSIYSAGVELEEEFGKSLISLYMILGQGLVESNGRSVNDDYFPEKSDFEIYLRMLQSYVEDNTERHHVDIFITYSKTGSKVMDQCQKDGSVKAPQKKP